MKSQRKWKHGKSNVEKVRRKEEARGVVVGYEIAHALRILLDAIIPRKTNEKRNDGSSIFFCYLLHLPCLIFVFCGSFVWFYG
jgi:hypothetical protein